MRAVSDDPPWVRCIKRVLVGMTDGGRGHWTAAAPRLSAALSEGVRLPDMDLLANLGATALHLGTTPPRPTASRR